MLQLPQNQQPPLLGRSKNVNLAMVFLGFEGAVELGPPLILTRSLAEMQVKFHFLLPTNAKIARLRTLKSTVAQ